MEEKEKTISEPKNSGQNNKLSTSSAIIVAGLLIAGGLFLGLNSGNNQGTQTPGKKIQKQQANTQGVDITKVKIKGEPFIGNPSAPVVMAYWLDYQCPFCKRFDGDAIKQVIKDYVSKGKVKIVFKDYQFLGSDSQVAGLAGRAVWEVAPNKYYQWHSAMYEKQDGENSGWGNKEDILVLTKSLGIDSVKVGQLMVSKAKEYQKKINENRLEGLSFGIKGTPGSIIGTNLISGAQPYSSVKQLIEIELQGK